MNSVQLSELDAIARETLGRSLTAAEALDVQRASSALRLSPGDVTLRRLIHDQQLQSLIREVLADQKLMMEVFEDKLFHREAKAFTRHVAMSLVAMLVVAVVAFFAGRMATQYQLDNERNRAAWLETPSGVAARRLHDAGLAERLANCSFAGWYVRDGGCFPGLTPDNFPRGYTLPRPSQTAR